LSKEGGGIVPEALIGEVGREEDGGLVEAVGEMVVEVVVGSSC
jgi:hypothetical protein